MGPWGCSIWTLGMLDMDPGMLDMDLWRALLGWDLWRALLGWDLWSSGIACGTFGALGLHVGPLEADALMTNLEADALMTNLEADALKSDSGG